MKIKTTIEQIIDVKESLKKRERALGQYARAFIPEKEVLTEIKRREERWVLVKDVVNFVMDDSNVQNLCDALRENNSSEKNVIDKEKVKNEMQKL